MQRNDDYIRDLMLELDGSTDDKLMAPSIFNPSPDLRELRFHAELLCDAGMFERLNKHAYRMTNHGHDYVAAIRSDTVWNKTKSGAAKVGGVTLGMMYEIAVAYMKEAVQKRLGM